MGINGIGACYPAWRDMGKAQRNGSGTGFADRMAGTDTVRAGSADNYIYLKAGKRFSAHDAYSRMGNMGARFHTNNLKAETNLPVEKVGSERYLMEPSNERGLEFERILSDEELEQIDRQKSETKTEIIVKPDGSRVLVMTMSIGGMETTMSLEISRPTEAPNENSEHDTDNNMSSGDAEMDAVSDEMSNISTET